MMVGDTQWFNDGWWFNTGSQRFHDDWWLTTVNDKDAQSWLVMIHQGVVMNYWWCLMMINFEWWSVTIDCRWDRIRARKNQLIVIDFMADWQAWNYELCQVGMWFWGIPKNCGLVDMKNVPISGYGQPATHSLIWPIENDATANPINLCLILVRPIVHTISWWSTVNTIGSEPIYIKACLETILKQLKV